GQVLDLGDKAIHPHEPQVDADRGAGLAGFRVPNRPRAYTQFRRNVGDGEVPGEDRKSTRLNSSHEKNSYAVFCLKKKKTNKYYVIRNKKSPDVCQNFSTKNNFIW